MNDGSCIRNVVVFSLSLLLVAFSASAASVKPSTVISFDDNRPALKAVAGRLDIVDGGLKGKALRVGDPANSISIPLDSIPIDWTQGTVSFWFKPIDWKETGRTRHWLHTLTPSQNQSLNFNVVSIGDGGKTSNGEICFQLKDAAGHPSHNWNGFNKWQNDTWYFVTVAWNQQTASCYLNGELDANSGGRHDIAQTVSLTPQLFKGGSLLIGSDANWHRYDTVEHSLMDQVEIRRECLNDDEVRALYYEQRPEQAAIEQPTIALPTPIAPRLTAPANAPTPVVDGNVTDGEWADAAVFTGLNDENAGVLGGKPFTGYMKSDGKHLYIAFKTRVHSIEILRQEQTGRDAQTYLDDSWEIFIRPQGMAGNQYQMTVNATGSVFDWMGGDVKWDGNWNIKQRIERPDIWEAELSIPLSDLGVADISAGEWRFAMFFNQKEPDVQSFGWTPLMGLFDQPARWAAVRFLNDAPIPGLVSLGKPDAGIVQPEMRIATGAQSTLLTLLDDKGRETKHELKDGEASHAFPALPGKGKALLSVMSPADASPDTAAFYYSTIIQYDSVPLAIKQVNYPSRQELNIEVNFGSLDGAQDVRQYAVDFGKGPQTVARKADIPWEKFNVSTNDLTPGDYQANVSLLDAHGNVLVSKAIEYTKEGAEEWLGNTVGIQKGYVPNAFEPLKINGSQVSYIGRTMEVGETGLPAKMTSREQTLLSSPVKIVGELNGTKAELSAVRAFQYEDIQPDDSTGSSEVKFGPMTGQLTQTISFDGFMWYDLELKSSSPVKAKDVAMEIRLPKAIAQQYLMTDPDYKLMGLNDWEIGDRLTKNLSLCFMPQIWLGNDEVGLAWLAETQKGWQVANEKKTIEVIREKDDVLLRINFVDREIDLTEPFVLGFGFQASPMKPLTDRQQNFIFTNGRFPEYPKDAEVYAVYQGHVAERPATFAAYTGLAEPADPAAALAEAAAQKAAGHNLTPYSEFTWCSLGLPEMKIYGGDWYLGEPWAAVSGMAANPEPFGLVDSENKLYQDFIVWRFIKNADAYGGSSIYYDLMSPAQNKNPEFKRAYTTRTGRVTYPWPLRSIRTISRRLYIGYELNNPSMVRFTHASNVYLPIVAFGDAWPVGEHFGFAADRYPEVLTYDQYRAWLTGYPLGLKTMFLPSLKSQALVDRSELSQYLCGVVFNHNNTFWVCFINEAVLRPYLRTFHAGEWIKQEYLAYWNHPHLTNLDSDQFKVSGWYNHTTGKGLLVVHSLSDKAVTADITLGSDWKTPNKGILTDACRALIGPQEYSTFLPGASFDGKTATFVPYGVLMLSVE